MFGVLFMKNGTYETALRHSQYYGASTYFYSFDFESDDTLLVFPPQYGQVPYDGGLHRY